eukprot:CAMPEP_0179141646 /NCGR_PEP_ID=MMETSP0796-20121207/67961_1 /TAXON_ID=73915 /ORGANISM="Pyrodinium bahamense, Strain pbaha01" /LENGTH=52 /DNA_ID=CAMNT_0020841411 /DNA_START=32 /DNA_END=186 /DNA_ORIENTATION=+
MKTPIVVGVHLHSEAQGPDLEQRGLGAAPALQEAGHALFRGGQALAHLEERP